MKNTIKKLFILILSIVFVTMSAACKKDEGRINPSDPEDPVMPVDPEKPVDDEPKATDNLLAQNGESKYEIIIPESASADIAEIAAFLRDTIRDATGATLQVKPSAEGLDESKSRIALGETRILADAQSRGKITTSLTKEALNRDGYIIKRLGSSVVIAGAHDPGVYYGVLEFLNRQFKYETYADDEIYYEKTATSYLLDFDLTDIPTFAGRDIDGYTSMYPAYAKQMRLTRVGSYNQVKQIPNDCHTIELYFHANKNDIGVDAFSYDEVDNKDYVPVSGEEDDPSKLRENDIGKYYRTDENGTPIYKTQKEYYFYQKYPNATNGYRLCLTHPKALKYTIRGAKRLLIENPDADFLNVSEMDMQGYCSGREGVCTCAEDFAKYKTSGVWVRFVNAVIEEIEQWRKDPLKDYEEKSAAGNDGAVAITAEQAEAVKKGTWNYTTFAYGHGTLPAPVKTDESGKSVPIDSTVIPHEKLYIKLAPLDVMCVNHAFNDKECTRNYQNVYLQYQNWKVLTDRFNTWSYMTNFRDYFVYIPYTSIVQQNAQLYRDMGVNTYFSQSVNGTRYCTSHALFYYLYAKTAWNCDLNAKETIDDFMAHYYRDAAEPMTKYIEHMNTWSAIAASKKNMHPGNYSTFSAEWYDKNVLDKASEYIEEAFTAIEKYQTSAPDLYAKLRKRLALDRIGLRYLQLSGYEKYYTLASVPTQGMQWLAEFKSDIDAVGVSFYMNEQYTTAEQCYNAFENKLKDMM